MKTKTIIRMENEALGMYMRKYRKKHSECFWSTLADEVNNTVVVNIQSLSKLSTYICWLEGSKIRCKELFNEIDVEDSKEVI